MESSDSDPHDRQNSLLTKEYRRYVAGEKSFEGKSEGYESKYPSLVAERVFHGLVDMALLGENRDRLDVFQVLVETESVNKTGEFESQRKDWRGVAVLDIAPAILAFLMDLTQTFNYGPADWENWLKEAYGSVNPNGFASVQFIATPEIDLEETADEYYAGESLTDAELTALWQYGLVPASDLPDRFLNSRLRTAFYEKPEGVERDE